MSVIKLDLYNLQNWDNLPEKEIVSGMFAKIVHTDKTSVIRWRILKDAKLPEHSHPHEQVTLVLNGELLLTVDGKEFLLKKGDLFPIKSNLPHSGVAKLECDVIDLFTPVRDDLQY